MREVTFVNRMTVAGQADNLLDLGDQYREIADTLLDAVRCCGEFPECSHVLAALAAPPALSERPSVEEQLAASEVREARWRGERDAALHALAASEAREAELKETIRVLQGADGDQQFYDVRDQFNRAERAEAREAELKEAHREVAAIVDGWFADVEPGDGQVPEWVFFSAARIAGVISAALSGEGQAT